MVQTSALCIDDQVATLETRAEDEEQLLLHQDDEEPTFAPSAQTSNQLDTLALDEDYLLPFGGLERRSISLDELLEQSLVHEIAETGERFVISRGWPSGRRSRSRSELGTSGRKTNGLRRAGKRRKSLAGVTVQHVGQPRRLINEEQKRRLLVDFLTHQQLRLRARQQKWPQTDTERERQTLKRQVSPELYVGLGTEDNLRQRRQETKVAKQKAPAQRRQSIRQLLVQYDLPAHSGQPIALGPPV